MTERSGHGDSFTVATGGGVVSALVYRAEAPALATLVLAHGAGADQRSLFMVGFSRALASRGVDVVTFNFLYTEQRRRAPDRPPVLEACYRSVIEAVRAKADAPIDLFIGGKSMGGRIATHVACTDQAVPLAGLVLLGYPLHPPGQPDKRRDAHLKEVRRPMFVVQGSRDSFGTPPELTPVLTELPAPATLYVVEGGDHSFKLARSGREAQESAIADAQDAIVRWMRALRETGRGSRLPRR